MNVQLSLRDDLLATLQGDRPELSIEEIVTELVEFEARRIRLRSVEISFPVSYFEPRLRQRSVTRADSVNGSSGPSLPLPEEETVTEESDDAEQEESLYPELADTDS